MRVFYRNNPFRSLLKKHSKSSGRNNDGTITVRHKGGAHKRCYRVIDFRRTKPCSPGRVERIEYDPNRNARIALVIYPDGERKYIIAPASLVIGDEVTSGPKVGIKPGNSLPLSFIPEGTHVHCVELIPQQGARMARSAGSFAILISKKGDWAKLKLKSGEIRLVDKRCSATIGEVGNAEHNLISLGKAGKKRWRGIRPTVRGVAMNPIDHPHGGGEGKTTAGRHPVSPWGVQTKGLRTRKSKNSDKMIISRRNHGAFN